MSAEAAMFHNQPEGMSVAWFAIPAPDGAGVIARARTKAHHGRWLLPGHLAASSLTELRTMASFRFRLPVIKLVLLVRQTKLNRLSEKWEPPHKTQSAIADEVKLECSRA